MKNGAIMAATALLIRIIAMFSGIYLSDTIGSEGMGLYRLILSVYFFFASAVSTGFSLTTTRLVTDFLSLGNKAQAKFAAEKCMLIAAAAGMMTGILMFLSKNPSSNCRRIGTGKRRCGSRASYLRILLTGSSNVLMRSFSKIKVAESRITTVWIQLSAENKVISDQINDLFPHTNQVDRYVITNKQI